MKHNTQIDLILSDRFGKDSLIALATVEDGIPHVQIIGSHVRIACSYRGGVDCG